MRRTGPSDTSPEAERVLVAAYRAMSPARKWALADDAYRLMRWLHAAGVRLRDPAASERRVREDWLIVQLGFDPRDSTRREPEAMDQPIESVRVLGSYPRA